MEYSRGPASVRRGDRGDDIVGMRRCQPGDVREERVKHASTIIGEGTI